jgi:competence protein ComEC
MPLPFCAHASQHALQPKILEQGKSMLRIHFLNVGHGDCTIISHPSGRLTMIDINNSQDYDADSLNDLLNEKREKASGYSGLIAANVLPGRGMPAPQGVLGSLLSSANRTTICADAAQELTDPIEFMQRVYPGRSLFRFILTHPDLDHMRGLKRLHETIGFTNFWDTAHTKPTPSYRSDADREDWEFYQTLRHDAKKYTRGDSFFAFGKDENDVPGGDNIQIFSPTPALVKACNLSQKSNDLSLVLRIHHKAGSVLLAGDAEAAAWDDMKNYYGAKLKSDYLKASHHGRDSGYHLRRFADPTSLCLDD